MERNSLTRLSFFQKLTLCRTVSLCIMMKCRFHWFFAKSSETCLTGLNLGKKQSDHPSTLKVESLQVNGFCSRKKGNFASALNSHYHHDTYSKCSEACTNCSNLVENVILEETTHCLLRIYVLFRFPNAI